MIAEKVAFLGVEKHSIVSVGSYGQIKDRVNRYFFEAGMDAMMETLEPEIVLVYSQIMKMERRTGFDIKIWL